MYIDIKTLFLIIFSYVIICLSLVLSLVNISYEITVDCEYGILNSDYGRPKTYTCRMKIDNLKIDHQDKSHIKVKMSEIIITSMLGKHEDNKSNKDVQQIVISKCIHENWILPLNISNRFENLEIFKAREANIKFVSKKTFAGMKKLKILDLSVNQIEMLEEGLFEDLISLEKIKFHHCDNLKFIDITVINFIKKIESKLTAIDFVNVGCCRKESENFTFGYKGHYMPIPDIIKALKTKCPKCTSKSQLENVTKICIKEENEPTTTRNIPQMKSETTIGTTEISTASSTSTSEKNTKLSNNSTVFDVTTIDTTSYEESSTDFTICDESTKFNTTTHLPPNSSESSDFEPTSTETSEPSETDPQVSTVSKSSVDEFFKELHEHLATALKYLIEYAYIIALVLVVDCFGLLSISVYLIQKHH